MSPGVWSEYFIGTKAIQPSSGVPFLRLENRLFLNKELKSERRIFFGRPVDSTEEFRLKGRVDDMREVCSHG